MLCVILTYVLIGLIVEILVNKEIIVEEWNEHPIILMMAFPILILLSPIWLIEGILLGIIRLMKKAQD